MNDRNNPNQESKHDEEDIKKREQAIRLREIELELYEKDRKAIDVPVYQPTASNNKRKKKGFLQLFPRKVVKVAKIIGWTLLGLVVIRLSIFFSNIILVGFAVLVMIYLIYSQLGDDK